MGGLTTRRVYCAEDANDSRLTITHDYGERTVNIHISKFGVDQGDITMDREDWIKLIGTGDVP